jgi:hypothetical protein
MVTLRNFLPVMIGSRSVTKGLVRRLDNLRDSR